MMNLGCVPENELATNELTTTIYLYRCYHYVSVCFRLAGGEI